MIQIPNIIDLPGYIPSLNYNINHGHNYITQHVCDIAGTGKEISFYNDNSRNVYNSKETLVAIWRIKERKQLA